MSKHGPQQITPDALIPGDILIVHDKINNFCRHALIVSEANVDDSHNCKLAHWLGMEPLFSLTESALKSEETLNQRDWEFHVFRLKDKAQSKSIVELLKKWLTWAVPFDKERYNHAENQANAHFNTDAAFFNNKSPSLADKGDLEQKLQDYHKKLSNEFENSLDDIIKYAARRDISLTKPKPGGEAHRGFHCVQGLLLAIQIAYIQDYVTSITGKWVSNKHTQLYDSALDALKPNISRQTLINVIPPAFRLNAKLCTVDNLRLTLRKDSEHIDYRGTLKSLSQAAIGPFDSNLNKASLVMYQKGLRKRNALRTEVVEKSKKLKPQ